MGEKKATRVAYGEYLAELGKVNDKIVVLDADLAEATNTSKFRAAFPERFFDCGIAEGNMVDMAAGLSTMGYIPFASTFAIFGSGRAYENIRNSVAYPHFNVKFAFTHAGISVGEDGGSHQAIEDIALMRVIPGMTVLVPADANETRKAVDAALAMDGPVYIRLARLASEVLEERPFTLGKADVLREGSDAALICCGLMVEKCLEAAELLGQEGISAAVINMQEHSVIGGLGDAVASVLCGESGFRFAKVGVQDRFGQSGTPDELFEEYGLTPAQIARRVKEM